MGGQVVRPHLMYVTPPAARFQVGGIVMLCYHSVSASLSVQFMLVIFGTSINLMDKVTPLSEYIHYFHFQ